jgi:protein-S-isoprenylcysteine O-methyltransferase Ste14
VTRGRAWFAVQAVAGAGWWVAVWTLPVVRSLTLGSLDPVVVAVLDVPLFVVTSAIAAAGIRWAAATAAVWTVLVALGMTLWATVTGEAGWGALVMLAAAAGSTVAGALVVTGRVPTAWIASGPFRFRVADDTAGTGAHVRRTAAQIVVFWGLALGVVPVALTWVEHRWDVGLALPAALDVAVRVVGGVAFLLASALGLASASTMSTRGHGTPLPSSTANRLVVAGPYRWVRNPMAIAGIAQGVAVGLMLSSWLVVVYALAGSIVWNTAIRPLEEADLEERFGEPFRRYRDAVRCWVPRVPRATLPAVTPARGAADSSPPRARP